VRCGAYPVEEVLPAVKSWVTGLDKADPNYEHNRLEALWTTWGMNQVDETLLREVLQSPDFHARAAAVQGGDATIIIAFADYVALLEKAAMDAEGRVRLEAIVAASWIPDNAAARKIVEVASALPLDEWSKNAAQTAKDRLSGVAEKVVTDHPVLPAPDHLSAEAKKQYLAGQENLLPRRALCHLSPA
jgi:hypothetical protein